MSTLTVTYDSFSRWIGGVAAPLVLFGIGLYHLVTRVLSFYIGRNGTYSLVTLTGIDAVIASLCLVFAAAYLHFHYYWNQSERLSPHAEGAKLLASLGFALSLAYFAFATIRFIIVS